MTEPVIQQFLQNAFNSYQTGKLEEAEAGYLKILATNTRHADTNHSPSLITIAIKEKPGVAGLRCDRLTALWIIDGPMNADVFEQYIKEQLASPLNKGDVVILDNLPEHTRDGIRRVVGKRGARLLFLPPYSPDSNPIEQAFSKFKTHMKRLKPRTIDDLWKAAGKVCDLFNSEECRNFFTADR